MVLKSLFPHFLTKHLLQKHQRLYISWEAAEGIKMPFLKTENKPGSCPAVLLVLLLNDGWIRQVYSIVNKL